MDHKELCAYLNKRFPHNHSNLGSESSNKFCKERYDRYLDAFTNPVTKEVYDIPLGLVEASIHICESYGIKGLCDPMYIANSIAKDMNLGDGQGHFTPTKG